MTRPSFIQAMVRRLSEADVGRKSTSEALRAIWSEMDRLSRTEEIGKWSIERKNGSRKISVGWTIYASNPTSWTEIDIDTLTSEAILVTDVMES